jgi:hypothetical protein
MERVLKALVNSVKVYSSIFKLTLGFSIFIFCSLGLLPIVSSYLNTGSAFLRFSSILYDMTPSQAFLLVLVGIVSLIFISLFLSSIITTIKMKETLDHFRFKKVWESFPAYVTRMLVLLFILMAISVTIGVLFEGSGAPRELIQILIACVWLPFVFAPQILILEDLGVEDALYDSYRFVRKMPKALIAYAVVGVLLLLVVSIIELWLSFSFTWEHKAIAIILVSILVLPFMQVFGTELYLMRYPLQHN